MEEETGLTRRVVKINTANFWTRFPNPVSISWLVPSEFTGPRIEDIYPAAECLVPPDWLVKAAKGKDRYGKKIEPITWDVYTKEFARHFWLTAHKHGIVQDRPSVTPILQDVFEQVASLLGVSELTLCCWEGSRNPECHRQLIYQKIPTYMKGIRA